MMSTYVRTCLLGSLTMIFLRVLGLSSALDIYMKNAVCMHTPGPVRLQGWSTAQEVMFMISVGRPASGAF